MNSTRWLAALASAAIAVIPSHAAAQEVTLRVVSAFAENPMPSMTTGVPRCTTVRLVQVSIAGVIRS